MRRKDREITDFKTIVEIIDECDVMRLGISDGDYPYIVPVNFGYEVDGKQIYFYIHGAMAGKKYEMLRANLKCSFEMDAMQNIKLVHENHDVTTLYKSVMGTATVEILDGEAKKRAVDHFLMGRYDMTRNFEYGSTCMPRTALYKLKVLTISAKSNVTP